MSYQRAWRRPGGKWGRRPVDDDETKSRGQGRRAARLGPAGDDEGVEWDVNEWSGVLYTGRIRNVARIR